MLITTCEVNFRYFAKNFDDINRDARLNFDYWEPESRKLFANLAKKSDLILDIGAYSGVYSIIAALVNTKSKIHCFEPNQNMHDILNYNFEINNLDSVVNLSKFALSDENSSRSLYLDQKASSKSSLLPTDNQEGMNPTEVETRTLDSMYSFQNFASLSSVLMKIDVEGFELNVLKGGTLFLKKHMPNIIMEALTMGALESQTKFLSSLGYKAPVRISTSSNTGDSRNYFWSVTDATLE
jgi:FkbM family methyltransferase